MKILIACENFYPSIGGVQEVCKQIATRLSDLNHDVYVATSWHKKRDFNQIFKIKIVQFKINGNYVRGIFGKKKNYIQFIKSENFEVIFIYAAQQWTLDLILPALTSFNAKKILVPCGFSKLYDKKYKKYFDLLSSSFDHFDHLIFHSENYRDFDFVKSKISNIQKLTLIPNGADENEFSIIDNKVNYKKLFNSQGKFLLMTNGSLSSDKGLLEVLQSFDLLENKVKLDLFINCDYNKESNLVDYFKSLIKKIINIFFEGSYSGKSYFETLNNLAKKINFDPYNNKFVKIVNLNRNSLIDLYKASDIFIYASKIEYSPLVIFEAMASNTAIISHNVGNVQEILSKTNAGLLAKSRLNAKKKSIIDIYSLANCINFLVNNPKKISELSQNGRMHFKQSYNWKSIFKNYLSIIENF